MRSRAAALTNETWSRVSAGLPRTFWFLWLGLLINRAGNFIVPMMTVYLTKERGLSLVDAGQIVAAFGAGSLIGTMVGGASADRFGRKITLLLSLCGSASFMLALGAAQEPRTIAALVLFLGLSGDMFRPALHALTADVVSPEHRLKAFGATYWAVNLGFSMAALLAGFVAQHGFAVLFAGDAATTLVCAAIIALKVEEPRAVSSATSPGSLFTPFRDSKYALFLLLNHLLAFVFLQHLTALPKDMSDKNLTPSDFGIALATNGLLIVLLQPFVLRAVSRMRQGTALALGSVFTGVGFGATALAHTLPAFVATVVLWTLGEVVLAPVNSTVVAERSPPHLRGRYQGAFGLSWSVAFLTSPIIGPRLIASSGMSQFWVLCLFLSLLAAFGFIALLRPTRR
jgi:MFS family permease